MAKRGNGITAFCYGVAESHSLRVAESSPVSQSHSLTVAQEENLL